MKNCTVYRAYFSTLYPWISQHFTPGRRCQSAVFAVHSSAVLVLRWTVFICFSSYAKICHVIDIVRPSRTFPIIQESRPVNFVLTSEHRGIWGELISTISVRLGYLCEFRLYFTCPASNCNRRRPACILRNILLQMFQAFAFRQS